MNNGDYIKLHRSLLKWEWYTNINTKVLFLHMLLKANWKEGKFEGIVVPRGSFVSSYDKLANEIGMTKDKVRTAMKHLISTTEVTTQSYSKYTVFTINNYDRFQDVPTQDTIQLPNDSHSTPIQIPTIEEREERKKERNNIYTCAFEEFWAAYPRKKDKGNAFKKFNARLKNGFSEVELVEAAKKYASECKKNNTEEKYIKHPSTFLSDSLPFTEYLVKEIPKETNVVVEADDELVGDDW